MTNNVLKVTTLILGLALALPASGRVVISEVAWMGTADSASAEWIELQNIGSTAVNLDGWTLSATDGSPAISLSGTLESGAFLILERTSDESLPGVSTDIIYTGALGNSGETLEIQDGEGISIDLLDFGSGWPAGDNDSKETMQRTDSAWITATPSPRSSTLSLEAADPSPAVTATSTPTTTANTTPEPKPTHGATTILDIHGDLSLPEKAFAGQHIPITGALWNGEQYLSYSQLQINFGDGDYASTDITEPLYHRYLAPGTYTVRYELRSQPWRPEPEEAGEAVITIVESDFWLRRIDQGIVLENRSALAIDLSGWVLSDGQQSFRLPPMSFLGEGDELLLVSPSLVVTFARFQPNRLIDPDGVTYPIQHTGAAPTPTQDTATAAPSAKPRASVATIAPDRAPLIPETSPVELSLASASQAPLIQKNQAPLWPWFGLGLLVFLSLGLFGVLVRRQPQLGSRKQSDQMDLFRS